MANTETKYPQRVKVKLSDPMYRELADLAKATGKDGLRCHPPTLRGS